MQVRRMMVTGGSGFIGRHLIKLLVEEGYDVANVDHDPSLQEQDSQEGTRYYACDIRDNDKVEEVFLDYRPQALIHLAAQTRVAQSVADPVGDAQANIIGTIRLMEACVRHKVERVLFASTAAVYGPVQELPIPVAHPVQPMSAYGASKLAAEYYIAMFARQHGFGHMLFRLANVYGPGQSNDSEAGVITVFVQRLLNQQSPIVYGDGLQTRDFIYVGDVAYAMLKGLCAKHLNGIYHVSRSEETSLHQILEHLQDMIHTSKPVIYRPPREGDIERSCLRNTNTVTDLDWQPRTQLREGLLLTVRGKVSSNEIAK